MSRLVLSNYIKELQLDELPVSGRFSSSKHLYPYQLQALTAAAKVLRLYFTDCSGSKETMFDRVYSRQVGEYYDLRVRGKVTEYLPTRNGKLHVSNFVNRAGFWMATGSGKTLVIVKLVELLKALIVKGTIPKKDILFLTVREDLLKQFVRHVEEYNSYVKNPFRIRLLPLSEFEREKRFGSRLFDEEVGVFFYRSDLLTDEPGEKRLDFESFYNDGNWYLILDEAHKGDKSESKAQAIFTAMSLNGFMFNFSATFAEELDFWTCAYEYNLSSFVRDGYGKHVYISSVSLEGFDQKKEKDLTKEAKSETVLKALLLHTWLCKLKRETGSFYPRPLTLVLANSVNTKDADLQMFFEELVRIAKGEVEDRVFGKVKDELSKELLTVRCSFTDERLSDNVVSTLRDITYEDVLLEFFNATAPSDVEARVLRENRQEIGFALKTSTKPFGIVRIGDISVWLKEKLRGLEVVETFTRDSFFERLDEEEINLLMGSRTFYEGWDNPRPNVLLYLNIGRESAKKFVLQSLGRGVRVSPVRGRYRRIAFLEEGRSVSPRVATALEFLYVFGTKAEALQRIVLTVQEERKNAQNLKELDEGLIEVNPELKDKPLLVPRYEIGECLADLKHLASFEISREDYGILASYLSKVPDVVLVFRHNVSPALLGRMKEVLTEGKYLRISNGSPSYSRPDVLMERFAKFLKSGCARFEKITDLKGDEITHFMHVRIAEEKLEKLRKAIRLSKEGKDRVVDSVRIMNLRKHYYRPVLVADGDPSDRIQHVIKHRSEAKFVDSVDEKEGQLFRDFDWWYFSKIDEATDDIYIPYYEDSLKLFYPDFVFWLKKGKLYVILFVDPKGTAHASTYRKIDGYRLIFEENGRPRIFNYDDMEVAVLLAMYNEDTSMVPTEYRRYWVSSLEELEDLVVKACKQASDPETWCRRNVGEHSNRSATDSDCHADGRSVRKR